MRSLPLSRDAFFWALQGICALHRKTFSVELAQQQPAAPYTTAPLQCAVHDFDAVARKTKSEKLRKEVFPLIAWLDARPPMMPTVPQPPADSVATVEHSVQESVATSLLLQADTAHVLIVEPGDTAPSTIPLPEFNLRYRSRITRIVPRLDLAADTDNQGEAREARQFGFTWFIPAIMYKARIKLEQQMLGDS